jgi:hypothetical protein
MGLKNLPELATVTLILTPTIVREFGYASAHKRGSEEAVDAYEQSIAKNFRSTVRARSVTEFETRWKNAVPRYSRVYDEILRTYLGELGSSNFRLAYIGALSHAHSEFENLSNRVYDLTGLYRRHVADSINFSGNYDEIFEHAEAGELERADTLLRESNYGITLLYLLLNTNIGGPLWIALTTKKRIEDRLGKLENAFRLPVRAPLSGSLKVLGGDVEFLVGKRK